MTTINLDALNFFITSSCNSRCRYCFYQKNLNRKNDLTFEQIKNLSRSLGQVRVLNISGGEPYLRADLPKIYQLFLKNNNCQAISIPTNALLPETIKKQTEKILKLSDGKKVVVCISLDGTEEFHDKTRGVRGNFQKAIQTYKNFTKLKNDYPNLSIRLGTVVYNENFKNLFKLFSQIPKIFPKIDTATLSLGRPEKFGQKILLPTPELLNKLFTHKQKTADSQRFILRKIWERLIFKTALRVREQKKQIISCKAGENIAVVYANGEVGLCEMLPSIGNIKQKNINQILNSAKAQKQRQEIKKGKCFCTHEGFLFYSLKNRPDQIIISIFK